MTQTIKASAARQHWSKILKTVSTGQTRYVIERHGIPVAVILPLKDYEYLVRLEKQRRQRFKVLKEIREAFKDVPPEEIEEQVTKAIREVRAQNRQREQNSTK